MAPPASASASASASACDSDPFFSSCSSSSAAAAEDDAASSSGRPSMAGDTATSTISASTTAPAVRSLAPSAEFTVPASSETAAAGSSSSSTSATAPALESAVAHPHRDHHHNHSNNNHNHNNHSRKNRLSLSFPIPIHPDLPSTPSTSTPSTPHQMLSPVPSEAVNFLTLLASQERRVLELREELQKAESELEQLKQQWMLHEATKKRREMQIGGEGMAGFYQHSQELREALVRPTRREELERLKERTEKERAARGKVMAGQRHQRTLSLLSPERTTAGRQPFPMPEDARSPQMPPLTKRHTLMNPPTQRTVETAPVSSRPLSLDAQMYNHQQQQRRKGQEALLQTGKQIADDFKEGLWTFIEDLKQATVGDDSMYHHPVAGTRRIPSRNNLLADATKGKQREEPEAGVVKRRASNSSASSSSGSEDNQSYRWSTSTTLSEPGVMTPHTQASTPRTSMSSLTSPLNPHMHKHTDSMSSTFSTTSSRSSQPSHSHIWGALASSTAAFMTPSQFKKHANALMEQVEKTLSLPPVPPSQLHTQSSDIASSSSASGVMLQRPPPAKTTSRMENVPATVTTAAEAESGLRVRSRSGTKREDSDGGS